MKFVYSLKNLNWYERLLYIPAVAFAFLLSSWISVFFGVSSNLAISVLLGLLIIFCAAVVSKKLKISRETKEKTQKILICLSCTLGFYFFISGKTIIWILLFFLMWRFLPFCSHEVKNVRCERIAMLTAFVFASFVFIGYQLIIYGRLEILYDDFGGDRFATVFLWLFFYACLICLFSTFLYYAFSKLVGMSFPENKQSAVKNDVKYCIVFAIIIFACWILPFVAFYPGVLSSDAISELYQQMGIETLSNHHPIIHQLFIKIGMSSRFLGASNTTGVGIYSFIQMVIMAFCFSCAVIFVKNRCSKKAMWIALLLFYALFPVNAVYSITMWKDVLFAGFSVLLVVLLIREISVKPESKMHLLLLIVVSFLFCTLRNNGKYAFYLGLPLLVVFNRADWRRLTAVFASVVVLLFSYQYLLFDILKISDSRSAEALSVPLQQIARVVAINKPDLEDERFAPLKEIFPEIESLKDKYNPKLSDPVKAIGVFESEQFDSNPKRYLESWLKLGIEYPVAYTEAFLIQNVGYWYPDITDYDSHVLCYGASDEALNISNSPNTGKLRLAIALLNLSLEYEQPTGIFFSPALPTWVLIFSLALLIMKKQYKLASPIIILSMIWLTTLASPVYNEFRYIYALFVTAPIFLILALSEKADIS